MQDMHLKRPPRASVIHALLNTESRPNGAGFLRWRVDWKPLCRLFFRTRPTCSHRPVGRLSTNPNLYEVSEPELLRICPVSPVPVFSRRCE